jgi:uncharacterized protein YigA (DUF484 family)
MSSHLRPTTLAIQRDRLRSLESDLTELAEDADSACDELRSAKLAIEEAADIISKNA